MQVDIEKRLQEVTDLISLPEIYLKIRQLMDEPDSDIYDFAEVIQVDPNLSARILKLVNSAYFGFPDPIDSISHSVNLIGITQLHNLVLGMSAISSLNLPNDSIELDSFWQASLYSGVLARLLAIKLKIAQSDQLFIAGLLHEIGHLVLYAKFPQEAVAAEAMAKDQGKPIHKAEVEVMGCHYGDIGAMLMSNWNLPARLQTLAREHPDPTKNSDNQQESALMNIAHICGHLKAKETPQSTDNLIDDQILALIGLPLGELEDLMREAETISAEMAKVIIA